MKENQLKGHDSRPTENYDIFGTKVDLKMMVYVLGFSSPIIKIILN